MHVIKYTTKTLLIFEKTVLTWWFKCYSPRRAGWRGTSCIWHSTGIRAPFSASPTLSRRQRTSPGKKPETSLHTVQSASRASLLLPPCTLCSPRDLSELEPLSGASRRKRPRPGGVRGEQLGRTPARRCLETDSAGRPRPRCSHSAPSEIKHSRAHGVEDAVHSLRLIINTSWKSHKCVAPNQQPCILLLLFCKKQQYSIFLFFPHKKRSAFHFSASLSSCLHN